MLRYYPWHLLLMVAQNMMRIWWGNYVIWSVKTFVFIVSRLRFEYFSNTCFSSHIRNVFWVTIWNKQHNIILHIFLNNLTDVLPENPTLNLWTTSLLSLYLSRLMMTATLIILISYFVYFGLRYVRTTRHSKKSSANLYILCSPWKDSE